MDIGRLTATLAVQNRGFVEANRAMQNLQKTTLQAVNIINNRLDALEGQVGALTGKLTAMGQASASANRMIGDSTAAGVGKATASFDTLSSKMHQAAMGLRSFGWLATTVFTLPIAAAGKTVLKSYSEFEYSMMKIVGLVGIARSEIEQWSVSVKEMSKSIGRSPLELADALYYVTSSGYKTAAALGVVEQSAKAAAAGLGETQDIADLVTSVMNAYGQGNISVAKTLDVLTAAVREGKGEASQYAKVLGSVVPFAAQLGVTFDEVSGAVASMTLSGASAANAATYLRNIFMKLLKPAKQSEDALRAMGSSTAELRNMLGEQGLMPTLIKIRELTNTYGEDMLGKVIPNIRAMLAELMLTGKNLEYNQQVMESVTNSNMDLAKAYQAVYDVTKNRLNRANAELKSSLIDLGESLKETIIPILENLAKTLANIVEWFIALDDSTKRTVLGFTAFLALIGPASLIASTFGLAIHQVAVWVNGLARAMGVLRVATIGASGPIGAAITLLGVGVVALARYQKRLTDAARDNNVFEKTLVDVNGEIKKLKELTAVDYSILGPEAIGKMNVQARNEVLKLTEGIQEAFMRGFEDNNSLKNMEVTIGGVTDKLKNFSQETQEAFKSKLAKKYTDEVVQGWETIGKTRQKFLMKEAGPQDDYLSKILIPNLLLAKKQYDETSVAAENWYKTWQEQLKNSRKTGTQTEDTFNATAALALMNEQLRQIGVLEKAYAELGVEGYDANKERLELYNDALREFIENGHGADAAAKAMAEAIKNLSFIVETSKNKLYQFGEAWSFIEAKEKALGDGFDATAGKLSMYNEMLDTFIETTTEAAKTGADLNKVTEAFVKHNGADIFEGNVPTTYEETLSRIVELIQKYIDVGASEELQKSIDLLEKQAKAFGDLDIYLELLKKRMQVTRSEMVKLANASKEGINSQAFKDAAKAFLDLKDAYIDLEASLDAEVVLGVAKAFGSYASAMDMVQVATNITEAKIRSLYEVIESNRGEAWTAEMEEQMGNLKDLREEVLKTQLAMESLGWIANLWDKLTDSIGEADEKWAKWVGNILRAIPQVLAFMQKYGELFGITFGNSKAQAILEKSVQNRNLEAASIEKVALAKQNENIAIAASLPLRAQANLLSEAMVMSKNKELEAISKLVPVTTTETAAKVADAGASAQAAVANSVNAATAIVAANAKAAEALASAVAEAAKMPFPYSLVAIALNSAAVTAALSVPIPMVTKMATGGVVPEGYPNDTFPALLSSGETVIPKGKAGEYAEKLIKEKQQKKRLVEFSPETEISSILIPKLQHGGEIPPGYPNDTYPAFLSSGETVLPKKLDFTGFAFGFERMQRDTAGAIRAADTLSDRIHNFFADMATGVLTWGMQFRRPNPEEIEAGRGSWGERLSLITEAATYGMLDEMTGKVVSLIPDAVQAVKRAKAFPIPSAKEMVYAAEAPFKPLPAYTNRTKYNELSIKADPQVREANTWMKNWYNDEATLERLDDLIAEQSIRTETTHPYEVSGEWENMLDRIKRERAYTAQVLPYNELMKDPRSWEQVAGRYNERYDKAYVAPFGSNIKATAIHEGTHRVTRADEFIPDWMKEEMTSVFSDFRDLPKDSPHLKKIPWRVDDILGQTILDYYTEPTEIYARMMEMRHSTGLKPGQKVGNLWTGIQIQEGIQGNISGVSSRFFELIKDVEGFTNLLNKLPAVAGLTAGGLALSSQEASAKDYEKAKDKYPEVFKIVDQRNIDSITGQPVSDYSKLHGSFDATFVEEVVKKALARGIDPYTALAIPHVETGGTPSGSANPFAVNYENPQQLEKLIADPIGASLDILRQKLKLADKLGYDTYAKMVQMYNGMGTLTQGAVGGKKAYGVEIPEEGISMKENPLYGKRIEDVRNNILMQNEELVSFVESLMKSYGQPTLPTALFKTPEPTPPEYIQPIPTDTTVAITSAADALQQLITSLGVLDSTALSTADATAEVATGTGKYGNVVSASAQGIGSVVSTAIQGGDVGKAAVGSLGSILPSLLSLIPGVGPILQLLLGGLGGGIFTGIASKMAKGGLVPSGYPNDSYPALLSSGEVVLPKEYRDMPDMLASLTRQGSIPSGSISDELQLLLSTYEINFPEEKFKSLFAPLMKRPTIPAEQALNTRKKYITKISNVNNYTNSLTKITKDQASKSSALTKQIGQISKVAASVKGVKIKDKSSDQFASLIKTIKESKGKDKSFDYLRKVAQVSKESKGKDKSFDYLNRISKATIGYKAKDRVGKSAANVFDTTKLVDKLGRLKKVDDRSLAYLTKISRGTEMTEKLLAGADYYPQVARMAGGGQVPSGYPNDSFPAMLSSGEYVLPKNVQRNIRNIEQKPQKIHITIDGKIKGSDIGLVLRRMNQFQ